jgi:hypothetical protein
VAHNPFPTPFSASRRSILTGMTALLGIAPIGTKAAVAGVLGDDFAVADLVNEAGAPTERARTATGRVITLRGYPVPTFASPTVLALSDFSPAPCQLCGLLHDSGPAIVVEAKDTLPDGLSMLRMIEASGRVTVADSGDIRLTDAVIRLI